MEVSPIVDQRRYWKNWAQHPVWRSQLSFSPVLQLPTTAPSTEQVQT